MLVTKERPSGKRPYVEINVARPKAEKTVMTRIPEDVDELAGMVAAALGKTKPGLIGEILRPALVQLQKEAAERLKGFKLQPPSAEKAKG